MTTTPRGATLVGQRLGVFEVQSLLGAGGMGEVYRARDTKLGRDVAIKVLPSVVANDPDRLARLAREARLLAALNHPHIATIYGLEEVDGVRALIMELVDGPTLAERLASDALTAAKPGLPIEEALHVCAQIAQALEAAHEKGIVHRDLKPSNLKLSPDGSVKVLDFGLAKGFSNDGDLSHLPTITASVAHVGTIAGTPAYMSPEQARGQSVDNRSDIWAFGCVVFEMITGRLAFSGNTISDTIAAILEREPDWSALPAATPPGVRHVLVRCLQKDLRRRWRDIGDVRLALEDAVALRPQLDEQALVAASPRGRERAVWAALIAVTAVAATLVPPALRDVPAAAEVRFDVSFPPDMPSDFAQLAISPDGQQLVAAASFADSGPLWLRPLRSTSGTTLQGTEGALFPFWSPDGASIGFFADGKLKRFDIGSQAVEVIADAPVPRGGLWQPDGAILYAPNAVGPLSRVPATGGQPTVATHLADGQHDHRAPFLLPDGQHFLYYARGTSETRGVYVARLDGSDSKRLLPADAAAVYAASGYLLFVRDGELLAQPFDLTRLTLTGAAFRLAARVSFNPGVSLASLSASASGAIAYGSRGIRRTQFAWFDRSGKRLETVGPSDQTNLANPTLSPDGKQVAFSRVVSGNWDIWLMDMQGASSRFTSSAALDFNPIWSSNGRQILFQSGNSNIYTQPINGGAPEQVQLKRAPEMSYPSDVSQDGHVLLYTRSTTAATGSSVDLWYVSSVGDPAPHPFVATKFDERDGQFSPDGKWVAYQSNESGHYEIYIQPFPGPGERITASAGGGQQVRWGRSGTELFYLAADQRLTSVPLTFSASGVMSLGTPVALFRTEIENNFLARQQYVVSEDGRRFLINAPTDALDPSSITVILNWTGKP